MLKRKLLATLVGATLGASACPEAFAQADTSGSARVGNLQFGNSLDPSGWAPFLVPDPRGQSWLHPGQLRTPTGVLHPYPNVVPDAERAGESDWSWFGLVQLGYTATRGDRDTALFREYADWGTGPVLGMLAFSARNAATGQYLEFRGSRISEDDQYYRLRAGRHGASRFEFFHRDTLHVLSTTAYPLWDGVGGTTLSLPAGLRTGSTPAAVVAAMQGRPRETLAIARDSTGAGWEGATGRQWIGRANASLERREGTSGLDEKAGRNA